MMTKKIKVMTVFGTRPEATKMAPVVLACQRHSDKIDTLLTVTAQHREMLDQVLEVFGLVPDYDLNIMKDRQTLSDITAHVLKGLEAILIEAKPDIVLVHGDTTTTFTASLAAFYQKIPVGHVEAGLRTNNKYSPYPEEMNRLMTGVLADLHFAPTQLAKENLLKENKFADSIAVTGNTAVDALATTVRDSYEHTLLEKIKNSRLVLMTAHRRENLGEPMHRMFQAIRDLTDKFPDIVVVYPVHRNPVVREAAELKLGGHERIYLIEPLDIIDFHNFAARSVLILTDSGGIQEEAPSLGVPVLVMRESTERPEGVDAGTLKLVGTSYETILAEASHLLTDAAAHRKMVETKNPYGDGQASERIVKEIIERFS